MGTSDRDARQAAGLLANGHIRADNITSDGVRVMATILCEADVSAQRCGIREGETLAEFIRRLHDEANEDNDDE
jgi:hypothetical protein